MKPIFILDLRSLAAMRILVGIILLCDLATRSQFLGLFYTDAGVLPREALLSIYSNNTPLSLHMACGSFWGEAFLFLMAGFCALNLLLGHRTRLFTLLSWLMLLSLDNRNLFIINNGDRYLLLILWWAMFLPWGEKFSVDCRPSASGEKTSQTITSLATAAFIVQVISVYVFSGIIKSGSPLWKNGQALLYSLSLEQMTKPMAHLLLNHPNLLGALTHIIPYAEMFLPCLFLIPFLNYTPRLIAIGLFFFFHIGIWLNFNISYFCPICMAALVGLLPPMVWDKNLYSPPMRLRTNIIVSALVLSLTLYGLCTNLKSVGVKIHLPKLMWALGQNISFNQNWSVFIRPSGLATQFLLKGTLNNQKQVGIICNFPTDLTKTLEIKKFTKEERLIRFMFFINKQKNKDLFGSYWGNHVCQQWNTNNISDEMKLKNVELIQTDYAYNTVFKNPKTTFVIFNYPCP